MPEFFDLLGIVIFLAISLVSALLDEEFPSILQYLFQGAAIAGLGILLLSQGRSPTDPIRFWIGLGYISLAVSCEAGLSVYLAAVRRSMALSSALTGTVTAPTFMVSAIFASSIIGAAGVSVSPMTIAILAVVALVMSLSVFGFLREAYKHTRKAPTEPEPSRAGPETMPPEEPRSDLPPAPPMMEEDIWAGFFKKKEGSQ